MAFLHLLGTGAAVSDPHRTTTMLALENRESCILVDCGGDAGQRLLAAQVRPEKLVALVITHEHPDHVGGFPLLMEKLWLHGRAEPLDVFGIEPAIRQARTLHDAFDTAGWPGYPGVRFHPVPLEPGAFVLERGGWRVTAAPGTHSVPVTGLRFHDQVDGGELAYSADTEYDRRIVDLACGAHTLVHEATGTGDGHSTAYQAARVAHEADVRRLILVHVPPEEMLGDKELREARSVFPDTEVATEGATVTF